MGHKRIHKIKPVVAERVRFVCLESFVEPVAFRSLALYMGSDDRAALAGKP